MDERKSPRRQGEHAYANGNNESNEYERGYFQAQRGIRTLPPELRGAQ
jgi:hypothetical protein